jgi:hypothetical protein
MSLFTSTSSADDFPMAVAAVLAALQLMGSRLR